MPASGLLPGVYLGPRQTYRKQACAQAPTLGGVDFYPGRDLGGGALRGREGIGVPLSNLRALGRQQMGDATTCQQGGCANLWGLIPILNLPA